jgi:hypothetical protein
MTCSTLFRTLFNTRRLHLSFFICLLFLLTPSGLAQLTISEAPYFTSDFITVSYQTERANPTTFVAIAVVNAPLEDYLDWDYAPEREGEVRLRLPDTPQLVEIRLLEPQPNQETKLLSTSELLEVISLSATLSAPAQVTPGETFEVVWEGPGTDDEQILLATLGSSLTQSLESYSVSTGGQVRFTAPQEPGFYELRYLYGERLLTMQTIEAVDTALAGNTGNCEVGDDTSLESAFEREASAFIADGYKIYGDQYSDVSYSYDTSTAISGDEGRVSASFSATLVTTEGETLERSGVVEATFRWSDCNWSLVDYSY